MSKQRCYCLLKVTCIVFANDCSKTHYERTSKRTIGESCCSVVYFVFRILTVPPEPECKIKKQANMYAVALKN